MELIGVREKAFVGICPMLPKLSKSEGVSTCTWYFSRLWFRYRFDLWENFLYPRRFQEELRHGWDAKYQKPRYNFRDRPYTKNWRIIKNILFAFEIDSNTYPYASGNASTKFQSDLQIGSPNSIAHLQNTHSKQHRHARLLCHGHV